MKLTLTRKSNAAKSHAYYVKNPGVWIRYYKAHRGGKGFKAGGALSKRAKTKGSKSRSIKTTKSAASKISKVAVEKRSIYSYGPKKNVKSTANLKTKKFKGDIKAFDKVAETKAKASIAKEQAKASKTVNEYLNRMKDSGKRTAAMRKKRMSKLE